MTIALLIVAGYLAGSLPFGHWVVRAFKHVDIRKAGSGHIGATNVSRTYRRWYGLPVDACGAWVGGALSVAAIAVGLGEPWPVWAFGAIAGVAVLVVHQGNLKRLVRGQEPRFELRRRRRTSLPASST